jgi:hypothetical protein
MELSQSLIQKGVRINKRGQIEFEVTTLGLTVKQWKSGLKAGGHKPSNRVKDILSKPDFDKNHRYEQGKTLKVFLIRATEIEVCNRATKNLQALAVKQAGEASVTCLKGELAFLIRKKFTNGELEEMDLWYIAVLAPIIDYDGVPCMLCSNRCRDGSWVSADSDKPGNTWDCDGAFPFVEGVSS